MIVHDLDGQHAVVTGAASGLGQAVAIELAAAGARVTLLDRAPQVQAVAESISTEVASAGGCRVDCGITQAVHDVLDSARAARGLIDIVVHAAGNGVHQELGGFDDQLYEATFDVHVRALFALTSGVLEDWRARGGGTLLAVTSPAAVRGQVDGGIYSAAKSAVIGFVRSAALELAPHGVRVNAILPMAATPMTSEVRHDPALDATYLQRVPLGRWGTPEEIAAFCRFIVSDRGSYITGAVLPIDGGRSL